MNKKEIEKLLLLDLERSGLVKSDANKMKLQVCTHEEAEAVLNSSFATYGYIIPYFSIDGKPTQYMRFKFLDELYNDKNKLVKYSQPKGTTSNLYFPPCTKWKTIVKDVTIPIVFTEGEKKAYTATKKGIPTIGLGGIWSFKSKKLHKKLLDEFDLIDFKGRLVYLCFDNDSHTNEDVMKALYALAKQLYEKGAKVVQKILPFDPYKKIGLDDYLLDKSKDDFDKLKENEFEDVTVVDEFNEKLAYIKAVGSCYIFDSGLFAGDVKLKNVIYSNEFIVDGEGKETLSVALWLKSQRRREHQSLTYRPGQPRITQNNEYNLWNGWGVEPVKGDVSLFLQTVEKLFNNNKEHVKWFLDWVAYPIQHPGAKMLSGVLLQSNEQGTGKSSIGLCIGAMYGKNFSLIDDTQLHGSFNEWAVNKQFILGDEISGKDKKSDTDRIKNLITRPEITINKKYEPTYTVPDCINYFFTSNHVDALSLEPDDRRVFVISIKSGNGLTEHHGQRLEAFRKGKGTAALLHYFIYEHKISKGFDHRARPPMTDAKQEMISHSLTDIERWIENLKVNPDHVLSIDGVTIDRDLFSTRQIISLYNRDNPKINVTETAMGKALNKIFSESVKRIIRTHSNGVMSLRAIRNIPKWDKADHSDWSDHYDASKLLLFNTRRKMEKK